MSISEFFQSGLRLGINFRPLLELAFFLRLVPQLNPQPRLTHAVGTSSCCSLPPLCSLRRYSRTIQYYPSRERSKCKAAKRFHLAILHLHLHRSNHHSQVYPKMSQCNIMLPTRSNYSISTYRKLQTCTQCASPHGLF